MNSYLKQFMEDGKSIQNTGEVRKYLKSIGLKPWGSMITHKFVGFRRDSSDREINTYSASGYCYDISAEEFMKEVKPMKYMDIKEGEVFRMGKSLYRKENGLPWHIIFNDWSSKNIRAFDINPIELYVEKTEAEIELEKLGQQIEELTKQYETASLALKGEKS